MEQTFGGFVRQRRSSMGITLRGLAARLGLAGGGGVAGHGAARAV